MYGVTQATFNAWLKAVGRKQRSVRTITRDEAFSLYKTMYWDEAGCDKLPFPVSYMVFDAAVNSGPSRADKWLQGALGTKQDGILGPKTLNALEEAIDREDFVIYFRIIDERLKFLVDLVKRSPSQMAFLLGWMRRLNRVLLRSTIAAGDI